jgi:hypothetical protein
VAPASGGGLPASGTVRHNFDQGAAMTRFKDLFHRYRHTLVIVSILLPATMAGLQTMRLHYLEARHQRMLQDFSLKQLRMQMNNAELVQQAAACKAD